MDAGMKWLPPPIDGWPKVWPQKPDAVSACRHFVCVSDKPGPPSLCNLLEFSEAELDKFRRWLVRVPGFLRRSVVVCLNISAIKYVSCDGMVELCKGRSEASEGHGALAADKLLKMLSVFLLKHTIYSDAMNDRQL